MALAEVGIQVRALDAAKAKSDIAAVRGEVDKLDAAKEELNRTTATEATVTTQAAKVHRDEKAAIDASTAAVKQHTAAQASNVVPITRGASAMKNFGQVAGQLSYQVQDFAVQLASGQSAFMAFAQQAPQAAGAFTMLGGRLGMMIPYIGTAIAIGAAVAPMFLNMGEKAKSAEDRIADLNGALSTYQDAVKAAGVSNATLIQQYGDLADEVRAALDAQVALSGYNARKQLREAMTGVGEDFTDALNEIITADGLLSGQQAISQAFGLKTLREDFGLAEADARALKAAFDALSAAEGPAAQAQAAASLQAALEDAYGSVDKMPGAVAEVYTQVSNVVTISADVATTMEDSRDRARELAGVDMASGISAAAAEAYALATALGISLEKANAIMQVQPTSRFGFGLGSASVPGMGSAGLSFDGSNRGTYASVIPYQPDPLTPQSPATSSRPRPRTIEALDNYDAAVAANLKRASGGRGKSEAQKESERLQKDMESAAESFYKATRTPLEEYAATLRELNDLKAGGFFDESAGGLETFNRAMADAKKTLDDATGSTSEVSQSVQDMFNGMMTDAENASDHFVGFVSSILNRVLSNMMDPSTKILGDAASNFLTGLLPGLGSSSAGATSGTGSVRSLFPSFDGGGYTGSGSRTGGVDGKGGFFAVMHKDEDVYDRRSGTGGRRGAQEGVHVTASVDPRNGNIVQVVQRTAGRMDAQVARAQQRAMPGMMADNQRRGITG